MKPLVRAIRQFHQARQKARKRLATARRGNQQQRLFRRPFQHVALMRVDLPATAGEPIIENLG